MYVSRKTYHNSRKRWKNGVKYGMLSSMKKLFVLLVLLIVVGFVSILMYREGAMAVNTSDTSTQTFIIKKGEDLNSIAKNLENAGLIRNKLVFYLVVKQLGIERTIQAGNFRLSPSMDAHTLAQELTSGKVDTWVTVVEGLRKEEIAELLNEELGISKDDFLAEAEEGYLFPETYLIPMHASASAIVDMMRSTFDERYTSEMQEKANELGLSQKEVVILASIVEREAKTDVDRQKVASVLLRRLENDVGLYVDATNQYALGYDPKSESWWKPYLTQDDLDLDTPYNTRMYKGLPPGPICSPSLSSLQAVVSGNPDTPYEYYISDKAGENMYYAETLEGHEDNIRKYLE